MARCSYCQEGGGRFLCPARGAKICRFCCANHQRREIDCPPDCQYLPKPSRFDEEYEETRLLGTIVRDHVDLLQNIEFALVSTWKEDTRVDDAAVYEALRAVREDDEARSPLAGEAAAAVREILDWRGQDLDSHELPRPLRRAACKKIMSSIRNHSSCTPGDTGYLRFVSQFVR
jgi:hypothetical protein